MYKSSLYRYSLHRLTPTLRVFKLFTKNVTVTLTSYPYSTSLNRKSVTSSSSYFGCWGTGIVSKGEHDRVKASCRVANCTIWNHTFQAYPCNHCRIQETCFQQVRQKYDLNDYKKSTSNTMDLVNAGLAGLMLIAVGSLIYVGYKCVSLVISNWRLQNKGYAYTTMAHLNKPELYRYKEFVIPAQMEPVLNKNQGFKVREDDIFLASFPRSGLYSL